MKILYSTTLQSKVSCQILRVTDFEAHLEFQTIDHEMNAKWDRSLSAFERSRP